MKFASTLAFFSLQVLGQSASALAQSEVVNAMLETSPVPRSNAPAGFDVGASKALRGSSSMERTSTAVSRALQTGGWSTPTKVTDDVAEINQMQMAHNVDGRLELFFLNKDQRIMHMWQTKANGNGWSAPRPLGGAHGEKTNAIHVVTNVDGTLEIFYRASRNNGIYHCYQIKGVGWSDHSEVVPNVKTQYYQMAPMVRESDGAVVVYFYGEPDDGGYRGQIRYLYQDADAGEWKDASTGYEYGHPPDQSQEEKQREYNIFAVERQGEGDNKLILGFSSIGADGKMSLNIRYGFEIGARSNTEHWRIYGGVHGKFYEFPSWAGSHDEDFEHRYFGTLLEMNYDKETHVLEVFFDDNEGAIKNLFSTNVKNTEFAEGDVVLGYSRKEYDDMDSTKGLSAIRKHDGKVEIFFRNTFENPDRICHNWQTPTNWHGEECFKGGNPAYPGGAFLAVGKNVNGGIDLFYSPQEEDASLYWVRQGGFVYID